MLVVAEFGQTRAEKERIVVSNAFAALLFIAAATSYQSYNDTGGDPTAIVREQLKLASQKTFYSMRTAHIREHQRLFHRVKLDLGRTAAADLPTDQRPAKFLQGLDPDQVTIRTIYRNQCHVRYRDRTVSLGLSSGGAPA